ncbi:MAG: hypothetical protein K6G54_05950 [Oscillospiraceae bacterium]|nr:hypothetical protein [Oscillospiraceae bacterium]
METRYTRPLTILPSVCDSSARLGVPDAFSLFMDVATEHSTVLGCGLDVLGPRGLFWLTVRTRVRFYRRPKMFERATLSTWPERPGKLRIDRNYLIELDGTPLVAGKTEWTVLDQTTGRLHPMADIFAPDADYHPATVWDEPFTRSRDEALEPFARYTVRSTDIDLGGHMNNAAYLHALAGLFSCADWQGMHIRELEIAYRSSCYEGDVLVWQKREHGDTIDLRAALDDGSTIALGHIIKG